MGAMMSSAKNKNRVTKTRFLPVVLCFLYINIIFWHRQGQIFQENHLSCTHLLIIVDGSIIDILYQTHLCSKLWYRLRQWSQQDPLFCTPLAGLQRKWWRRERSVSGMTLEVGFLAGYWSSLVSGVVWWADLSSVHHDVSLTDRTTSTLEWAWRSGDERSSTTRVNQWPMGGELWGLEGGRGGRVNSRDVEYIQSGDPIDRG